MLRSVDTCTEKIEHGQNALGMGTIYNSRYHGRIRTRAPPQEHTYNLSQTWVRATKWASKELHNVSPFSVEEAFQLCLVVEAAVHVVSERVRTVRQANPGLGIVTVQFERAQDAARQASTHGSFRQRITTKPSKAMMQVQARTRLTCIVMTNLDIRWLSRQCSMMLRKLCLSTILLFHSVYSFTNCDPNALWDKERGVAITPMS